MAPLKLVSAFVLCILVTAPMSHAITCGQVSSSLVGCIGYLTTGGTTPPEPCCDGVRSLNAAARTTPDRQTACNCLKQAAGQVPGIKYQVAAGLPDKCGVNIPYSISPSTDCTKVV